VPLASGEYEIGFYPLSEVLTNTNVRNLGLVPESLQVPTVLEASIGKQANDAKAAAAFVKFLRGHAIDAALKETGMVKAR
jgi:ABC-type molybdate transport system substrate-binding protein